MADEDFDPLAERTPTGPAISSSRFSAPAPAAPPQSRPEPKPAPTPVTGLNASQFADLDNTQAAAAVRLNAPLRRPERSVVHHQTYDAFRKEYIIQSFAGLLAVVIVMVSIVVFGVFVSGQLILIFSFLFLPFICGIGIFLSLRRPGALIISIGILIALSAGILASFAFAVYYDVERMPLFPHVNASVAAQAGQYPDRSSIVVFDKPVTINKEIQGKHCYTDQLCYCVSAIQGALNSSIQPNITYWAACPLLSDENCMDLVSCLGEWNVGFNAGVTLERNTDNRQNYWLAVQNAVNSTNGTLNPTPGDYVILYWEEDPRVLGGMLLATGWLVLAAGFFGYIGLVIGCWLGCYERMRRSAASDSERAPLFGRSAAPPTRPPQTPQSTTPTANSAFLPTVAVPTTATQV